MGTGFLFLGDMDGLSLANGTENGEPRLRFIANSSDIRNRFLSDVRYTWDDDDCSTLDAWCFEDGSEDSHVPMKWFEVVRLEMFVANDVIEHFHSF